MEEKVVLVTGIGGNVGQGIIRNIRKTKFPIKVIGCNVTPFSAGNHLCDKFYEVPYAYSENFIDEIEKIVQWNNIDLIIPSTDYEVYYLAKHKNKISCQIVTSDEKTAEIYLDKFLTYLHHKKHNIPFAESCLPTEYIHNFDEFLVKPREGRGSRGIVLNPSNVSNYDNSYLVQKLFKGIEITTAFYVNKHSKLHGFISMERHLENGATIECRVNRDYDIRIREILEQIIINSSIKGSANLQCIVTEDGYVAPFEINCRISGTNSIRSNFGFEDVKYMLEEYLFNLEPSNPSIINGVAVRVMMDVIYPEAISSLDTQDRQSNYFLF